MKHGGGAQKALKMRCIELSRVLCKPEACMKGLLPKGSIGTLLVVVVFEPKETIADRLWEPLESKG